MATILIAEDEKGMQEIIADYMKRDGHTCITADDGIDAISILKNNPVDLAKSVIFCGQFNTYLSVSLPAPAFALV